jgi:hypothetical protein
MGMDVEVGANETGAGRYGLRNRVSRLLLRVLGIEIDGATVVTDVCDFQLKPASWAESSTDSVLINALIGL